jgi:hypothetical protein
LAAERHKQSTRVEEKRAEYGPRPESGLTVFGLLLPEDVEKKRRNFRQGSQDGHDLQIWRPTNPVNPVESSDLGGLRQSDGP